MGNRVLVIIEDDDVREVVLPLLAQLTELDVEASSTFDGIETHAAEPDPPVILVHAGPSRLGVCNVLDALGQEDTQERRIDHLPLVVLTSGKESMRILKELQLEWIEFPFDLATMKAAIERARARVKPSVPPSP